MDNGVWSQQADITLFEGEYLSIARPYRAVIKNFLLIVKHWNKMITEQSLLLRL